MRFRFVKSTLKWSLVALSFFIDVHLKASPLSDPPGCWGKSFPCAVSSSNKRDFLKVKDGDLVLGASSAMSWRSPAEFRLVNGAVYIHHSDEAIYTSPYGRLRCANCSALLERKKDVFSFHVLSGKVEYKPLGESEWLLLPAGYMAQLGPVQTNGKAFVDIPQASPLKVVLKLWAKVYIGSADAFKAEASNYIQSWRQAVESSSQLQSSLARREIASAEATKAHRQARIQAEQHEDEKLRELFRKKNGLDENP
jgi:hypothetical protein